MFIPMLKAHAALLSGFGLRYAAVARGFHFQCVVSEAAQIVTTAFSDAAARYSGTWVCIVASICLK